MFNLRWMAMPSRIQRFLPLTIPPLFVLAGLWVWDYSNYAVPDSLDPLPAIASGPTGQHGSVRRKFTNSILDLRDRRFKRVFRSKLKRLKLQGSHWIYEVKKTKNGSSQISYGKVEINNQREAIFEPSLIDTEPATVAKFHRKAEFIELEFSELQSRAIALRIIAITNQRIRFSLPPGVMIQEDGQLTMISDLSFITPEAVLFDNTPGSAFFKKPNPGKLPANSKVKLIEVE